jgi:tRNA threonylcarbamoyladenosine biosynthesis protein TsaB
VVILLAIDTCDSRGSVALLRDSEVLQSVVHETAEDYSSWLLPSAERVLRAAGLKLQDVDVFAPASGPGSFTGLRVGLTAVKAWCEVYGKPAAPVARLEALAIQANGSEPYVAAFLDAQREQVFWALFRGADGKLKRIGEDVVAAPGQFLEQVLEQVNREAQGQRVAWISMDPASIQSEALWLARERTGERIQVSSTVLAPFIGLFGHQAALEGRLTDALHLDAHYVRRSDAEIFWKRGASIAR